MLQAQAVWLLMGLSVVGASLPFVIQRPLVCWPWTAGLLPAGSVYLRGLFSALHLLLLAAWAGLVWVWIGGSLAASLLGVSGRLLLVLVLLAALLGVPAHYTQTRRIEPVSVKRPNPPKPFISRLLEWLVLYGLTLALGFALEAQLGNPFPQGWPFYAITLSLYGILAFPAFVWRYLLRR